MSTLVIDYDWLVFSACMTTDRSFILAKNKCNNEEYVFKNKTEFYGDWRKKSGGWLAEINSLRKEPWVVEDFILIEEREIEPIEKTIMIAKTILKSLCNNLGTTKYYGYASGGVDTFRHKLAKMQPYKGSRLDVYRPVQMQELKEYLVDHHNCKLVTELEADDYLNIDGYQSYKNWKLSNKEADKFIVVGIDKDNKSWNKFWYNPDQGKVDAIEGFGSLWRKENSGIDGKGRLFLGFQIAYGDDVDCYHAAALSKVKNGPVAAYKALEGVKTDKEMWQALVNLYQKLYPSDVTFTSHTGEVLTIDWLFALQEITSLAHMQRWHGDALNVEEILKKLEVKYDS
jgi:hypothetical protein